MDKQLLVEDRRVQRTRKLIEDAFIELTVEMGFAAVTVRHITDRAMINRSTFYRYYDDKYRLLDALTGETLREDFSALSDDPDKDPGPVRLLRYIQQRAEFFRVMLGTEGDPLFAERFRRNTERRFRSWLRPNPVAAGAPLDMRLQYVAHAGVGAILWWLEHGQHISPEECARWLSNLNMGVMAPFTGDKGSNR